MITTSAGFKAAQAAAVNKPRTKVFLFLGDYARLQTAASSTPFSADYPAAGAVNGDRTEINIGPATGADNGVGQASFKSAGIPDNGDSVYFQVSFAAAKYINYIKLYQRQNHGLSEYWIDALMDGVWQPIAHRVTGGGAGGIVGPATQPAGFGNEPFGDTPFGSPWPPYVENEYPLTLAAIDLGFDVLAAGIRVRALHTQVALDLAEIVELEAYRKIDITSRVVSWDIEKKRDFKFQNSLAYTATLVTDNSDQFFSSGYVPTDAERMAGFGNEDLISGVGINVQAGFEVNGADELVDQFTGFVDDLFTDTPNRQCNITARDFTQFLLARKDYSRAKFNVLIEDCVQYILNRYGVSNYEMDVADTYRRLVVFFSNGAFGLDIIRDLAKAATDGDFFVSESGVPTFKNFASANEFSINSYDKWAAGTTITNVALDNPKGCIRRNYVYDHFNADALDATLWNTVQDIGENPIETVNIATPPETEYALHVLANSRKNASVAPETITQKELTSVLPFSANDPVNIWFDLHLANLSNAINQSNDGIFVEIGLNTGADQNAVTAYGAAPVMNKVGYYLIFQQGKAGGSFEGDSTLRIIRVNAAGTRTVIAHLANWGIPTTPTRYCLQKNGSVWTVYAAGASILSATETGAQITGLKYAQLAIFASTAYTLHSDATSISADVYFQNILYGYSTGSTATYISQIVDRGTNITAAGTFSAQYYATASGAAAFSVRFSDDGISWGAWLAVSPPADLSGYSGATKRYAQAKVEMSGSLTTDVELPIIAEIAFDWGETNAKYSPVADFDLQGQLLGSQLKRTNTLAGENVLYNSFKISSTMPSLVGNDTDILFSFFDFSGFISALKPKYISADTVLDALIPDGMDTSFMAGANPASIVAVYKSGTISTSYVFTSPTKPKILVSVSSPAVITDLHLQGKKWDRTEKFTYQYVDIDIYCRFRYRDSYDRRY